MPTCTTSNQLTLHYEHSCFLVQESNSPDNLQGGSSPNLEMRVAFEDYSATASLHWADAQLTQACLG